MQSIQTQATTGVPALTPASRLRRRKAGNVTAARSPRRVRKDGVSKAELKPDTLGQVFTPASLVAEMLAMRQHHGRTLEPSCGSGAFAHPLHRELGENLVALELDADHATGYAKVMDFFDYPDDERFKTIIGNPPYLRHQDIPSATRDKLAATRRAMFDGRTNLYLFFIEKCVRLLDDGGELIFVVPREFRTATAARRLNRWLATQGSITHFRETGDEHLFDGASPPCCVFRFEKGRTDRRTADGRLFGEHNGQFSFLPAGQAGVPLSTLFDVAVGGITGADDLFARPDGNLEVVCSKTGATGETRKMLDGAQAKTLLAGDKQRLMARGVRKFSEANWSEWGRAWKASDEPRVYVNAKTRRENPFFTHDCTAYDGSVLALFPKRPGLDVAKLAAILNRVDWDAAGMTDGERFHFGQRTLMDCLLPASVLTALHQATTAADASPDTHAPNTANSN